MLEPGSVLGGGDDQDVLDPCKHQGGERVVDHGLVIDRQQLLAGDQGQGIESGAGSSG